MTDDLETEDRLRSALHTHTDRVHPDEEAGLDRIRHRSAQVRARRRVALAGVAAAVVAVAAVTLPRLDDDGTAVEIVPAEEGTTATTGATGTTATTATTTETTVPATTEATGAAPTTEVTPTAVPDAVWPGVGATQFSDPEAAARSFVEGYVGIDDPPLGAFRAQGDDAGEIDVFTRGEDGAVRYDLVRSTLSLRRAGGIWGVMSASSDAIVVDVPAPLSAVGDPLVVEGRATGYEATIFVTVRAAGMGAGQQLAGTHTLAGAGAELEPFRVELDTGAVAGASGSVLVENDTAGVGLPDFTVVPVRFS